MPRSTTMAGSQLTFRQLFVGCVLLVACAVLAVGCSSADERVVEPPPIGAPFDYQLGGDAPLPPGVGIVARDWFAGASPPAGIYGICYINAFQTQPPDDADRPDERGAWPAEVVTTFEDPQWPGEFVIDLATPTLRAAAADHVMTMIDRCAERGFRAVEFDNLDSYSRFEALPFGLDEALLYATALVRHAHSRGLAAGQKNTVELTREQSRTQVGFDFVVVEECGEFDECLAYRALFDDHILDIEYLTSGLLAACSALGDGISIVRRDVDLVLPGAPDYVYATCADASTTGR